LSPLQCRYKYYKDLTSRIGRFSAQGQVVIVRSESYEFKTIYEIKKLNKKRTVNEKVIK